MVKLMLLNWILPYSVISVSLLPDASMMGQNEQDVMKSLPV
jgi:hypothetical protein